MAIEKLFRRSRGVAEDSSHYFEEILVFSTNLLHLFVRSKKQPQHAIVFVCRKSANVGMVIAKGRLAMSTIEAAL